jgi:hypothetical protein
MEYINLRGKTVIDLLLAIISLSYFGRCARFILAKVSFAILFCQKNIDTSVLLSGNGRIVFLSHLHREQGHKIFAYRAGHADMGCIRTVTEIHQE